MKKFFFAVTVSLISLCTYAQVTPNTSTSEATPQQDITTLVKFNELDHDFGKIPYGKPVEYEVTMKNIGKDSIKIQNVQAGCGCTTPKWQPGPYAPGETFKITVGFNGYTDGIFNKVVTIYFTNGLSQLIRFHGETFKAPDKAAPANNAVQKLQSPGNN